MDSSPEQGATPQKPQGSSDSSKKATMQVGVVVLVLLVVAIIAGVYRSNKNDTVDPVAEVEQTQDVQEEMVNVTVTIGEPVSAEVSVEVPKDSTAEAVMEKGRDAEEYTYESESFDELGTLITSIGGVEGDDDAGKYWSYYVNGEMALEGVSTLVVNEGDEIEWKYEESSF